MNTTPITCEVEDVLKMLEMSELKGYKQDSVLCGIDAYDLWCHEQNVGNIFIHDHSSVEIVSSIPRYAILVVFSKGQKTKVVSLDTKVYA